MPGISVVRRMCGGAGPAGAMHPISRERNRHEHHHHHRPCGKMFLLHRLPTGSPRQRPLAALKLRPAITLSRQTGSGARAIAGGTRRFLQSHDTVPCPWTVFDKSLVEKVLEEHKLPKETARFMPEDRVSAIQDAVEELLGLHPSSRTLVATDRRNDPAPGGSRPCHPDRPRVPHHHPRT